MSERKINLDEFIDDMPFACSQYRTKIKHQLLEFGKQLLKLAAEKAEIKEIFTDDYYSQNYNGNEHYAIHTDTDGEAFALTEYVINKQSILDTIKQIK